MGEWVFDPVSGGTFYVPDPGETTQPGQTGGGGTPSEPSEPPPEPEPAPSPAPAPTPAPAPATSTQAPPPPSGEWVTDPQTGAAYYVAPDGTVTTPTSGTVVVAPDTTGTIEGVKPGDAVTIPGQGTYIATEPNQTIESIKQTAPVTTPEQTTAAAQRVALQALQQYKPNEDGFIDRVIAANQMHMLRPLGYSDKDITAVRDYAQQVQAFKSFEESHVKLGDGSYMAKEDFNELRRDPTTEKYALIAKTQGYNAMVRAMNIDAGIKPPPTTGDIRAAQAEYFQSRGWDIEDKTSPDYGKRIIEATRAYSDSIGYTTSQAEIDAEMWAERKSVAKESVMQIVPFEYLREGRWEQLQGWERIVYPITDVAMLIPVVGVAGKAVAGVSKTASVGAKVAALGGKEAVNLALKDAAVGLEKGAVNLAAKRALVLGAEDALKTVQSNARLASIYTRAIEIARADAQIAAKELSQMTRNVAELQKLAAAAEKTTVGTRVYQTATAASKIGGTGVGTTVEGIDRVLSGGAVTAVTVMNWDDLEPWQKAVGLGLGAIVSGVAAPVLKTTQNALENVVNPAKIPKSAIAARRTGAEAAAQVPGSMWSEAGGKAGGTTRLIIDSALPPEQARAALADALKRQHQTGADVTFKYGEGEVTLKGTGFQGEVGGDVSFSATPMGDIFKEGTGAFGKKTNLEKYLEEVNQKLPEKQRIEIESRPYTAKNLETGANELITTRTASDPGVTVVGKEGGAYVGQAAYTKFAHQAAYGSKGSLESILLIHDPGIRKLPKALALKRLDEMEQAAIKLFDGSKYIDEIVEGFKQYRQYMEAENVITNGSQIKRVQNLRSKLADRLKRNRGEYFTRDKQGRIELFQMYIEGGRTSPYTLKELYALKGNALKNALSDLRYGLNDKWNALKKFHTDEKGALKAAELDVHTKEDTIAGGLKRVDDLESKGVIGTEDAARARAGVIHDTLRAHGGRAAAREAARLIPDRVARLYLAERGQVAGAPRGTATAPDRVGRTAPARVDAPERAGEAPRVERADIPRETRTDAEDTRVPRTEDGREEPRPEAPRDEPPRVDTPRTEPPRMGDTPPRTQPPRAEPPRIPPGRPPREELPRPPREDITRRPPDEPPVRPPSLEFEPTKKRPTLEEIHASRVWPQGFGWWYVWRGTDGKLRRYFHPRQKPLPGTRYVPAGEGEAYRGIQDPTGGGQLNAKMPLGVVDVHLSDARLTPGEAGAINFTPRLTAKNPRIPV